MRMFFLLAITFSIFIVSCSPEIESTTTTTTTTTIFINIDSSIPFPKEPVRLTFIHQKLGASLLSSVNDTYGNGHLALYLNKNNYFVTDITKGWDTDISLFIPKKKPIGNFTEIVDLIIWFNPLNEELLMNEVFLNNYEYPNNNNIKYSNIISKPSGSNEIILFKVTSESCEVGDSSDDEISIYNDILKYTIKRSDKLFIFFTPPPKTQIYKAEKTRQFCNYLSDMKNGWLKDYSGNNVGVFDIYNVLTNEKNIHTANSSDDVVHFVDESSDNVLSSKYSSVEDKEMVNNDGLIKVTQNFIPLLNYYYNRWKNIKYK
ncbi:MAG TPA: hypothetical protein PK771_00695 [Spirochaetota bacterium]|nr:hypothetical protein [Spirochaetota bacterium]